MRQFDEGRREEGMGDWERFDSIPNREFHMSNDVTDHN